MLADVDADHAQAEGDASQGDSPDIIAPASGEDEIHTGNHDRSPDQEDGFCPI